MRGLLLAMALCFPAAAMAQAHEDAMSEAEVETLRETAAVPVERIAAFERMLDDREHTIEKLLAKPRRVGFGLEMHDVMDQFGAITDELNDNLEDYSAKHRDVRNALPKLLAATERWSTALRAPANDDQYKIVQKIALNTLQDTHELVVATQTAEEQYFKEHPDEAKAAQ